MVSEQPLIEGIHKQESTSGLVTASADSALWQSFKSGSENAYALIYQRYFAQLYDYGVRVSADPDLVKDCIQDLFLHIWNNKATLTDVDSIKFYLLKALKSRLINHFSKNARFCAGLEEDDLSELEITISTEQSLIEQQITKEQQEAIVRALDKLTGRQKEAVVLKFYKNRRNEEIADDMSISIDAVYNLIYQALGRLKNNVEKVYGLLLIIGEMI